MCSSTHIGPGTLLHSHVSQEASCAVSHLGSQMASGSKIQCLCALMLLGSNHVSFSFWEHIKHLELSIRHSPGLCRLIRKSKTLSSLLRKFRNKMVKSARWKVSHWVKGRAVLKATQMMGFLKSIGVKQVFQALSALL